MPQPTIVFDLDGTLIDSAPDLIDTLNFVLMNEGVMPFPFEQARALVGFGARRLIQDSFDARGHAYTATDIERMFESYVAHYADRIAKLSRPFPGLENAIEVLQTHGCRLAVCTYKLEWLAVKLLDELGLSRHFSAICGQDSFGIAKPTPDILRRTVAKAGGEPGCAVMIGDSATDIRTAQAAAIPVVFVDFGYSDATEATLGPDRTISHFDALPEAVFALLPQIPGREGALIGNLR
ncbi:MAG: HAD-IA family hydrolase [Pseudorhodoplanes sp.]